MILIDRPSHGQEIDKLDSMYPTKMISISKDYHFHDDHCTMFGVVTAGKFEITSQMSQNINARQTYQIKAGNFMSIKTGFKAIPLEPGSQMFAIIRYGYIGLEIIGEIEDKGRLAYIDGCTDTLLVSPPRKGDACLNLLHFPTNITQTQHLHPSIGMGVVLYGQGVAWQDNNWEHPLIKGAMFCLDEGETHSFKTTTKEMNIIAYHPDSDFGPTDENHPMLNKTLINHGSGTKK